MPEPHSLAVQPRPALALVGAASGSAAPAPLDMAPAAPPGVIWLPGEEVLLLAVPLPSMPAAQRRVAIAFAVEDHIAQPLDDVLVMLGPPLGQGTWLAAVVTRGRLEGNAAQRLLPDTLALPVPAAGWAVWAGARVLVRSSDGAGFACRPADLPLFWSAAGSPAITLYGGSVAALPVTARADLPGVIDPALAGFDLADRRGATARGLPRGWRGMLAVLALAVFGHLALVAADVLALQRLAAGTEADLRAALAAAGQPAGADPEGALAAALAARQPAGQGGFLPLMAQVFAALAPQAGQVTLTALRYDAGTASAEVTFDAPDLGTLQAVESALAGAGLGVAAGAATTGDGGAEVQMLLSGAVP